jgi:hypothetical protein
MKVIFEIFSTFATSMTVIDPEDLNVWPISYHWQLIYWMNNVEDDRYSIFIILPDKSYISVCGETFN